MKFERMLLLNCLLVIAVVLYQHVDAGVPNLDLNYLLSMDEFDINLKGKILMATVNVDYRAKNTEWSDYQKLRVIYKETTNGVYEVVTGYKVNNQCQHFVWNMKRENDTFAVFTRTWYNDDGAKKIWISSFLGSSPADFVINAVCLKDTHDDSVECSDGFVVVFVKEDEYDADKDGVIDNGKTIPMEDILTDINRCMPTANVTKIEWTWFGQECSL